MFKVYWTDEDDVAHGHPYADLSAVLIVTKNLRDAGMRFVTMVSEDPNCVGKMGVDTVADGKTPDGVPYSWVKRRNPA
jgi:hypothetical protein